MIAKTTGIVLHTLRYGESSLIVHVYTEHFGRISLMAKGVKNAKKPGRTALLQPLKILSMEVYYKPSREIQMLKEFDSVLPEQVNAPDPVKGSVSLFIAELLYKVLQEEEPNEPMFRFLYRSILDFNQMQKGITNYHLYFAVHLTKYLGFFPSGNFDEKHCLFDGMKGKFVEQLKAPVTAMPQEESALLAKLMTLSPQNLDNLCLNGVQRSRFLDEIIKFYQIHLEGMGKIRSIDVLKEVFSANRG